MTTRVSVSCRMYMFLFVGCCRLGELCDGKHRALKRALPKIHAGLFVRIAIASFGVRNCATPKRMSCREYAEIRNQSVFRGFGAKGALRAVV